MASPIKYRITPIAEGAWAVERVGPRGGVRLVAEYDTMEIALAVQSALVKAARHEVQARPKGTQ